MQNTPPQKASKKRKRKNPVSAETVVNEAEGEQVAGVDAGDHNQPYLVPNVQNDMEGRNNNVMANDNIDNGVEANQTSEPAAISTDSRSIWTMVLGLLLWSVVSLSSS